MDIFDHIRVVRSKRKTLCITIDKEGNIVARAPMRLEQKRINDFVLQKKDWICKHLQKRWKEADQTKQYKNYEKLLFLGKDFLPKLSSSKVIALENECILIPKQFDINICECQKTKNKLKKWYISQADQILFERLDELSKHLGIGIVSKKLLNGKSKWGSCNKEKLICLNWRLIMLPPSLVDYVLVHELAHTKVLNHSKEFWVLVDNYLGRSHKPYRSELKKYTFLMDLFR